MSAATAAHLEIAQQPLSQNRAKVAKIPRRLPQTQAEFDTWRPRDIFKPLE